MDADVTPFVAVSLTVKVKVISVHKQDTCGILVRRTVQYFVEIVSLIPAAQVFCVVHPYQTPKPQGTIRLTGRSFVLCGHCPQ